MTYEEVCDKYRDYKGVRFVEAAWGGKVPLFAGADIRLWLPVNGTFQVVEKYNEISIFWTKE